MSYHFIEVEKEGLPDKPDYYRGNEEMSILIKGMEMPNRQILAVINPNGLVEVLAGNTLIAEFEAVSVPPHGRLIDADVFESIKYELPDGQKAFNRGFHSGVQYVQRLIMDAPTIISAEENNNDR